MRLCLSGWLFLLLISLPSGDGFFGNDGVSIQACTVLGGRCYFGCKPGWQWVMFCHSFMSCCKKMKEHKPPQFYQQSI